MNTIINMRHTFYRTLPVLVGICLCMYFSYHTVSGHRSYARLSNLTTTAQQKATVLSELKEEKKQIEAKVRMMRPDSLSADILEEQARFILGYKHQDEFIVLDK